METKDKLERIRKLTADLILKQSRAESLRIKCKDSSSVPMPWQAAELQALEEEIEKESEELGSLREAASDMIATLGDSITEYVLISRYLDGMTWREISERSGYSRTWITKLHARGIKTLSARIDKHVNHSCG